MAACVLGMFGFRGINCGVGNGYREGEVIDEVFGGRRLLGSGCQLGEFAPFALVAVVLERSVAWCSWCRG